MLDYSDFIKTIKKVSLEAVANSDPTSICFGKVISANPIKIQVEQKIILGQMQLVIPKHLSDYTIDMTVNHTTENKSGGSSYGAFDSHNHAYSGKKSFTVHNSLVVGDNVILIAMQGGQKYIVMDKVVSL